MAGHELPTDNPKDNAMSFFGVLCQSFVKEKAYHWLPKAYFSPAPYRLAPDGSALDVQHGISGVASRPAVRRQAVESGRSHLGVAEHGGPFAEGEISGDHHRSLLEIRPGLPANRQYKPAFAFAKVAFAGAR